VELKQEKVENEIEKKKSELLKEEKEPENQEEDHALQIQFISMLFVNQTLITGADDGLVIFFSFFNPSFEILALFMG